MYLAEFFVDFYKQLELPETTLQGVVDAFGKSGHLLAIFVLALPFCQPIPLPGLSTPFGISIALLSLLYLSNRTPKLPKWLGDQRISQASLQAFSNVVHKVLGIISTIVKPRLVGIVHTKFVKFLTCLNIIYAAVLLALPLPIPFSNTVPAIVIIFAAIGYLLKDALAIACSLIVTVGMTAFFWGIFLAGARGWHYLTQ